MHRMFATAPMVAPCWVQTSAQVFPGALQTIAAPMGLLPNQHVQSRPVRSLSLISIKGATRHALVALYSVHLDSKVRGMSQWADGGVIAPTAKICKCVNNGS